MDELIISVQEITPISYEAVCGLFCFDWNFRPMTSAFIDHIENRDAKKVDSIIIPGGAKDLASPATPAHRDVVLEYIATSMAVHNTTKVICTTHACCKAYGWTETVPHSRHMSEHRLMRAVLQKTYGLHTEHYYFGLDKIYQLDPSGWRSDDHSWTFLPEILKPFGRDRLLSEPRRSHGQ